MSRKLWALLGILVWMVVFSFSASGQDVSQFEIGLKPYGSYHGGNIDSVSLTNGNLTLHIPLYSYPQRGGKLSKNLIILYNNKGWRFVTHCDRFNNCTTRVTNHLSGVAVKDPESVVASSIICQLANGQGSTSITAATTGDGSSHALGDTGLGYYESIDGSGIRYDPTANVYTDRSGIRYLTDGSQEDPNGNQISAAGLDTLGRTISTTTTSSDTSGCPAGQRTVNSSGIISLPGPAGGTTQLKLCNVTVPLQTNFADVDTQYTGSTGMIQSVVLYNGSSWSSSSLAWTFEYDSRNPGDSPSINYGDLSKVTFPTGGTLTYEWTTVEDAGLNQSRAVSTRTLDASDGSGAHTWTYTPTVVNGTNVVTDPLGNDTVYTITYVGGGQSAYVTQAQYYQGSHSAGTLLKTETTDYIRQILPDVLCGGNYATFNVEPIRVTTTWPGGNVSKVEKDYDINYFTWKSPNPFNSATYAGTYGDVVARREYGYGSGGPGALTRQTITSYLALSNANYKNNNLVDLASTMAVQDGAGNQIASTTYGYDETAPNSSGITTQHDSNPPAGTYRGNQTSVGRWLNTTGGTLTSTATIYDTGMVYVAKDPNQNPTTYAYSSTFAGAYPTTVTNALNQNNYFNYDFNTGLLASVTDVNSQTTSYGYDALWRTELITYPPGSGSAAFSYVDSTSPSMTLSRTINGGANYVKTALLDGIGRVTSTELTSDPAGTDYVSTTYDAAGRKATVSNPYRSTGDPTYGITSYGYDALARVTSVGRPDGNTVSTSYSANCATVTDEQSKSHQSCSDALGRMTQVIEDPGGLGYSTTYSYNALDDLTGVVQGGQTRTFNYDSLSRLTSAANPESGTVSYSYDADGNLTSKQDARGITTTYCPYDALNRVVCKSYSDGTPRANFFYDQAPNSWPQWSGVSFSNAIGRLVLTCTNSPAGTCNSPQTATAYSYDAVGHVADLWQCTPFNCSAPSVWNTHNTYDLAGDVTNWTHPSGTSITYSYDAAQRVVQVNDSISDATHPGLIASATYTPFGALSTLTNGCVGTNCVQTQMSYSYNNRLQPVMMQLGTAGSPAANYCQVYNYYSSGVSLTGCSLPGQGTGNNGNLMGSYLLEGASGYAAQNHQMAYSYDRLNRLLSATAQTLGGTPTTLWSQSYMYDRYGNMTCSGSGICVALTYNTSTNRIATFGNQAVTYDAAGNLKQDGNVQGMYRQYSYDAEGHVTQQIDIMGNVENDTYNALGQVVESATSSYQEEDFYDAFGMGIAAWCIPSNNWCGPEIHLGAGGMILGWDAFAPSSSAQTQFLHKDALGSTRLITDHSGAPQGDQLFYPWGDLWSVQGVALDPAGFAGFLGALDTDAVLYGTLNREYAHTMGRWLTPDPGGAHLGDPQTWDAYAYVGNNPINRTDPDGDDYYLLGGSACGDAVSCDKQGYVTDDKGNRVVISDQDFLNGTNGVHGSVDANGGITITTSQGTFQGQFTGSIVQNFTVGVGHDEAVGMMLQDAGRMAQNGVAVTSFVTAPAYLIPAAIVGTDLAAGTGVTNLSGELGIDLLDNQGANQAIGEPQRALLRQLFKTGEPPPGLRIRALRIYREIAERAIQAGKDGAGFQKARIQLIDAMIQRLGGR